MYFILYCASEICYFMHFSIRKSTFFKSHLYGIGMMALAITNLIFNIFLAPNYEKYTQLEHILILRSTEKKNYQNGLSFYYIIIIILLFNAIVVIFVVLL